MSLGQEPLVTVLTLSKVPETANFRLGPCWRERMFRTNWSRILASGGR